MFPAYGSRRTVTARRSFSLRRQMEGARDEDAALSCLNRAQPAKDACVKQQRKNKRQIREQLNCAILATIDNLLQQVILFD